MIRGVLAVRSARLPAVALFALLGWALVLAPAKAEAGCAAAYVTHSSGLDQLVHLFDPLILGAAAAQRPETSLPADSGIPRPCSGPSCSGNPLPPPVLPSMTEARYVEPWVALGRSVRWPQRDSRLEAESSPALHPLLAPATVFHPPRGLARRSDV